MIYAIALLCVLGISAGQILFKLSSTTMREAGTFLDPRGLVILVSALALYGFMTLAWVWVLQKIELGRVYPLMALAFVLVPLGSHIFLGERFQTQYLVGIALIVAGIAVVAKA